MSWALERRALILTIIGLVALAILAVTLIATLYETPSCMDGKQNQDEEGIDCGGSCAYVCKDAVEQGIAVQFVRPLSLPNGRVDIVAYVENKNYETKAVDVRYTVEVYNAQRTLLASKDGTIDVPAAGTIVPIFIPFVYQGTDTPAQAFITFDETTVLWERGLREEPVITIEDIQPYGGSAPRVTAQAVNTTALPLPRTTFVVVVRDQEGTVMAASQTVALGIPPFTGTPLVFTWNTPFPRAVGGVEVRPVPAFVP